MHWRRDAGRASEASPQLARRVVLFAHLINSELQLGKTFSEFGNSTFCKEHELFSNVSSFISYLIRQNGKRRQLLLVGGIPWTRVSVCGQGHC